MLSVLGATAGMYILHLNGETAMASGNKRIRVHTRTAWERGGWKPPRGSSTEIHGWDLCVCVCVLIFVKARPDTSLLTPTLPLLWTNPA